MTGYIHVNLNNMISELGEDRVKSILSDFSCPLNPDVEEFLRCKAIEFAKQGIARTHLIFASYKEEPVLVGYFALATKFIIVSKTALSGTLRKKITKFGQYNNELKRYIISAPLIGQLGKNFSNGYNKLITGDELLKMATNKIELIQQEIGGKIVYLECEDKECLKQFYNDNGFVTFGKRPLDPDEVSKFEGEYLIQMLKYLRT